jgi:molybdate/tungstate transport system permease protein
MKPRRLNLVFSILGGLLVVFILLPLVSVFISITPAALWESLLDPVVFQSIGLTFLAAGIATALAALTGIPLAYLLARRRFWGKQFLEALVNLPVIVPHIAAGVALLLVFGRRGILGSWLAPLGIFFTDNLGGIVVAMLFVSLPYLVNASRDAFSLVDRELELVALADGATPWQAFRLVTLPLAWRGVFGGALMMWARGMSEFGAVIILAYHPKIAPLLIYERFEGFGLDGALPVAALLILIALGMFIFVRYLLFRREEKNQE